MPSISPAGQPWNVESVIWSERRGGEVEVAEAAQVVGDLRAQRLHVRARVLHADSIQPRTGAERMPARS